MENEKTENNETENIEIIRTDNNPLENPNYTKEIIENKSEFKYNFL